MNENVIAKVLTELSDEIKEIRTEQILNSKAVEMYTEAINHFEEYVKQINVTCPPPDITQLVQLINTRYSAIEKVIAAQPKEVLHEKRILLYPEGDKQNFWKFIADRFLRYSLIILGIYATILVGLYYWKANSENERYKYAYFWIYKQQNDTKKQFLYNTIRDFENDSIFKLRKENVNPTFEE
jgi:hypothetical protein